MTKKAYSYGLIIERAGPEDEVIKCMMPLTTSYAELAEALDISTRLLRTCSNVLAPLGRKVPTARECHHALRRRALRRTIAFHEV